MRIIRTAAYGERRFRASIYIDIFVDVNDLEPGVTPEQAAKAQAEEYAKEIPNSYVGGVAAFDNTLSDLSKL